MSSVDFVLSNLDQSLTMSVSGDILKAQPVTITADATAEFYVDTQDFQNIFMFQTDSDDVDTITNETDTKYFVRKAQVPANMVVNPCHAWVSTGAIATADRLGVIADNRELVKHDFIRHIAKSLFNTHLGVDLFTNEDVVKYDLAYKGHNEAWLNGVYASLNNVSDASLNVTTHAGNYGTDASYGLYLTNDASGNDNLCRELLKQIAYVAPNRLATLGSTASIVVDGSNGYYKMPFLDGDSISFVLTVNAAENQHLLVNSGTPVPARTYRIRLNIRDTVTKGATHADGTNVIVSDTAPALYDGVSVTDNLNTSFPYGAV
jgi:hypothetical protein